MKLILLFLPALLLAKSPVIMSLEKNYQRDEAIRNPIPYMFKKETRRDGFHTEATFLFWQASEDGLEFAATNSPTDSDNISANLVSPDFDWDPGFKFLFGYHFPDAGWDLDTRWTWFYSKTNTSTSKELSSNGDGLFPLWIPQQAAISTIPVYANSDSTLHLHLNTFDIELACSGEVSKTLFFKIHGGLKGIDIDQKFNVSYSNGFFDGTNQMLQADAHLKTTCKGLGPRIGLGTRILFPKGLSFLADCAVASALSDMKTKREDSTLGTSSGVNQTVNTTFKESFWVWRPLIEAKTGLEWSYLLFRGKGFIALDASYEIQQYWEQNMMVRYGDAAIFYVPFNARGNLFFQGLSLSITLGY